MSAEESRTIGFICPKCHQSVIVERSLFSLTAAPVRIACPCGGSYLQLEYQGDRFSVEAPCIACGGRHKAHCPEKPFLHQKALGFSCAKTGLECCFVGEEAAVFQAVRRLEERADQLAEQEKEKEQDGAFLNELVMSEMLSELKEIAQRDAISCVCGSHEYRIKIHYSSIELECAHCGGTLRLDAATMEDLNDLCCKDHLELRSARQ